MGLFHSPSVVTQNLVLYYDFVNQNTLRPFNNLINPGTWTLGTGGVTGFSLNGTSSENQRVFRNDPWGNQNIVWEAYNTDIGFDDDGGWNGSNINIDRTKKYRFSVWVNRTVRGNGPFYFGTSSNGGILNAITGALDTNPYFIYTESASILPTDQWVLVVGHVLPVGTSLVGRDENSGIYNISGVRIAQTFNDFIWNNDTTVSSLRTYLYYSTDSSTMQRWIYPRIDLIDGTEPTIAQLIENRPNTLKDLSGNNNDGYFVSVPSYSSGGLNLDGVNDSLMTKIPITSFPALSSWSMSVWAKPTSLPANLNNGVILGAAYYSGAGILWRTDAGVFTVFGFVRGMDGSRNTSVYNCSINSTYNFTLVNDRVANRLTLYVNGLEHSWSVASTQEYDPSLITTAGNIGISKNQIYGGGNETYTYFPGTVYNAQLYNKALSAIEVSQNFNTLRGRYGL